MTAGESHLENPGRSLRTAMRAAFVAAALGSGVAVGASRAAALAGTWVERGPLTTFRFAPCGAATCGLLEDSIYIKADADARDVRNPDVGRRSRRLKGLSVLQNLQRAGAGWRGRV